MATGISWIIITVGLFFFTSGTIALVRFPDMMSRLHALTKADNLGLGLVIVGLILHYQSFYIAFKLILIWLVVVIASASCSHLIANAAYLRSRRKDHDL